MFLAPRNLHHTIITAIGLLITAHMASAVDTAAAKESTSRGNAYYRAGDYTTALAKFDEAITQDATYAPAHANRGLALMRLGQLDNAHAALDQAITLNATDKRFHLNLGKIILLQGDLPAAIAEFDAALAIDATYTAALVNRAWCREESEDYTGALTDYQAAATISPACYEALNGMGIVHARMGNLADAEWWFWRAIAATSRPGKTSAASLLSHRNLRILRGYDFSFSNADSGDLFAQGINQIERGYYTDAKTTMSALATQETASALAQDFNARAIFLENPVSADLATAIEAANVLLPTINLDSTPQTINAYLDYQPFASTPIATHLFPGAYTYTLYDGSLCAQTSKIVSGNDTFSLTFPADASLDINEIIDGPAISTEPPNAIDPSQTYRINAQALMRLFALHGYSVLPNDELARHNLWITAATGFFQGEEASCALTASTTATNITLTKSTASYSSGDEWIEFTTTAFTGAPAATAITIDWTSPRMSGSLTLAIYHDQDGDGLSDYQETVAGSSCYDKDTDDDDMDDLWEYTHGLDPNDANDADADPDNDKLPNYGEWAIQTDPQDPLSPPSVFVDVATGDDASGDGSETLPWKTIQHAIGSITAPKIIRVAAGTYREAITLPNRIALIGAGAWGPSPTTLTPPEGVQSRVLSISYRTVVGNVCVTGGKTSSNGGGIYISGTIIRAYVFETEISKNSAKEGGGCYADGWGLGTGNGIVRFSGCVIKENSASSSVSAGGLHFFQAIPTIVNTLISSNSNGGVYCLGAAALGMKPRILSCTIANNTGDGIEFDQFNGVPVVCNSIVWDSIWYRYGDSVSISNSCMYETTENGVHTIHTNPQFINAANGDYRLRPESPCIDAGDGESPPSIDFHGQQRWDYLATANTGTGAPDYADIGFSEFYDTDNDNINDNWEEEYFGTTTPDAAGDEDGDELSNGDEFAQGLLPNNSDSDNDGLEDGDELYADGTHGDTDGHTSAPRDADSDDDGLLDGPERDNGTNPNDTDTDDDELSDGWEVAYGLDPLLDTVDIDSDTDGIPDFGEWVIGSLPNDPASPPAIYLDAALGNDTTGDGSGSLPYATVAAALAAHTESPLALHLASGEYTELITLRNGIALIGSGAWGNTPCILHPSTAGRPITIPSGANATVGGFLITGGSVTGGGGGISFSGTKGYLFCSEVRENVCSSQGGGVYTACLPFRIARSRVTQNTATSNGGGINAYGRPTIANTLIDGNQSNAQGGAIYHYGSYQNDYYLTLKNSTIAYNTGASNNRGGIVIEYSSNPRLTNSILWGNGTNFVSSPAQPITTYCCIQSGTTTSGNINANPQFTSLTGKDYHLQANSPCIDTGTTQGAPSTDLNGRARPQGLGIDMGAFERASDSPNPPIVTGSTLTNNTTPEWSWTSGGEGNGQYRRQLDAQADAWTYTTDTVFTPATPLTSGTHTLYVQECDVWGNWSSSGSYTTEIDATSPRAPQVTGIALTANPKPEWTWTHTGDPFILTFPSPDAPKAISDLGTTNSTLTIPKQGTIEDINVHVQCTHTFDGDLDVYLISPQSTTVELFTDVGSNGDNFTNTLLDDEAANSITAGTAPFTGTYKPEGLLAKFDGQEAQGSWTLRIIDDTNNDTGTLQSWSLEITALSSTIQNSRYRLDSESGDWTGTTPTTFTPQAPLTEGSHTLYVQDSDSAGNWSISGSFTTYIDLTPPVISLNGDSLITLDVNSTWTDPGANATDNYDSAVTVTTAGNVDLNTTGDYTLTYTASDTAGNDALPVTRTVTVADRIAPVITLTSDAVVNIDLHDTWTDPGATATDNYDPSVTVTVSGTIDFNAAGTYTLYYYAADTAGNPATTRSRTINVLQTTGDVEIQVWPQIAQWTIHDSLDGTHDGTGSSTLTSIPTGSSTLTWKDLPGFDTPEAPSPQVLAKNSTILFTGRYDPWTHSADTNRDWTISATEVSRVVGFYNAAAYHQDLTTNDGFAPGLSALPSYPHDSDFNPQDGRIAAIELGRLITFYNAGAYTQNGSTPDGFAPQLSKGK